MIDGNCTYTRRIRHPVRLRSRTWAIVSICAAAPTFAAAAPAFRMEAVLDAPGGTALASGDYVAALAQLDRKVVTGTLADRTHFATNLCVASAKLGRFAQAVRACGTAVSLGRASQSSFETGAGRSARLAVLYTHRAIARQLAHDLAGADADYARATRLSPASMLVQSNQQAFEARRPALVASEGR